MDGRFSRVEKCVLAATGARRTVSEEILQGLWSGYGEIVRVGLDGGTFSSAVVKYVNPPEESRHPRGWNTDRSHDRKVRSYQVEAAWYREWSARCDQRFRVPAYFGGEQAGNEILLVLEDLDAVGFPCRLTEVGKKDVKRCLEWLAQFHAEFMQEMPDGLWKVGTYWHLDTRPDEWNSMEEGELKNAAKTIDSRLKSANHQTFVHGDAKLANFCFSKTGDRVAAVDFQYVGGGCGMKDVAYFLGSCLDESSCESEEDVLLDIYFDALRMALEERDSEVNADEVEEEWRELFPWAWADFHRFLMGWSPGHWKMSGYSEKMVERVLASIK